MKVDQNPQVQVFLVLAAKLKPLAVLLLSATLAASWMATVRLIVIIVVVLVLVIVIGFVVVVVIIIIVLSSSSFS